MDLALIPALFHTEKPPLATSILTSICLGTIATTYITLDLTVSAMTVFIGFLMWSVLALQKAYRFERNNRPFVDTIPIHTLET